MPVDARHTCEIAEFIFELRTESSRLRRVIAFVISLGYYNVPIEVDLREWSMNKGGNTSLYGFVLSNENLEWTKLFLLKRKWRDYYEFQSIE
ncbi:MAG TPA: hypothetical protein DCY16_00680 [Trichococcus sp.]|nr:hypothetical protein [Trichococcus sp.]HBQ62031.1 hypothetical protein [Trichococcus sp.]